MSIVYEYVSTKRTGCIEKRTLCNCISRCSTTSADRILRERVRKLRLILPVISVSIMALHHQNAELDRDIASVLSEHACKALDQQIETPVVTAGSVGQSCPAAGVVCMSTLEDVRTLRATALRLLPGFWQARAQMNVAIGVLEYFVRNAEHELKTGIYQTRPVRSAD